MFAVLRHKSVLAAFAALLALSLLVWIPIIGKFSLEDPQPVAVDPASINEDPKPFLGRRVQVEGEVQRIFGPRAFALERDDSGGQGASLLIVGRKPWTLLQKNPQVIELLRNDRVQVMGRVRRFSLEDFRQEAGRHARDSLLARWEGRPVLVALDIELTPGVPDLLPGSEGSGRGGSGEGAAEAASGIESDSVFGLP